MNQTPVHQSDIRIYQKLIMLSRQQLASIHKRLTSKAGWLDNWLFMFRNQRLKKNILKLLKMKTGRIGDAALAEMMDDYRAIEAGWKDVTKDELDYIRLIVHGLRDVTEIKE